MDEELNGEKHWNEVQNRLIDQINDKIKQLQRIVDELLARQKEEARKLAQLNDALEKERKAKEDDEHRNAELNKKLQELRTQYQKTLQDANFDDVDSQIKNYHEGIRADLYALTTGELYEKWKNGIVDDNVLKTENLGKLAGRSVEIPGKQPENLFDEQKS